MQMKKLIQREQSIFLQEMGSKFGLPTCKVVLRRRQLGQVGSDSSSYYLNDLEKPQVGKKGE
jgi:hypothetical protein